MFCIDLILYFAAIISLEGFASSMIINSLDQRQTNISYQTKLILLDRDGVVNEDLGPPGVTKSTQLSLTYGAGKAIGNLRREGCKVALVTNQSCVGKNLISEQDLANIHDELMRMLVKEDKDAILDKILYCTSLKNSFDYRMKPNPGMILEACEFFQVSPKNCILIGDAIRDLQAAASAGVPLKILVETGYGIGIMNDERAPSETVITVDDAYCKERPYPKGIFKENSSRVFPFMYIKDLYSASKWILEKGLVQQRTSK